jgi:hypothetical protein
LENDGKWFVDPDKGKRIKFSLSYLTTAMIAMIQIMAGIKENTVEMIDKTKPAVPLWFLLMEIPARTIPTRPIIKAGIAKYPKKNVESDDRQYQRQDSENKRCNGHKPPF